MRYIKSRDQLNEELNRTQRAILHLPMILGANLFKKLTGIEPLLNYKWTDIKKKTIDSKFDPLFARSRSSSPMNQINDRIEKIELKDIPKNKLGFTMFFKKWNIYRVIDRTHSDHVSSREDLQRPIVYISRDVIKTSDYYLGERISDRSIYVDDPDFKVSNISKYPIIVMIAKADKAEETTRMEDYITDICVELEDNFPVFSKIIFDKRGDQLEISIFVDQGYKLYFDDNLDSKLESVRKGVESYLKLEGYKLRGKIKYFISDSLWYYGDLSRFTKSFKKSDTKSHDGMGHLKNPTGINIARLSYRGEIGSDDLRFLINDKENCFSIRGQDDVDNMFDFNPGEISELNGLSTSRPDSINIKKIKINFEKY